MITMSAGEHPFVISQTALIYLTSHLVSPVMCGSCLSALSLSFFLYVLPFFFPSFLPSFTSFPLVLSFFLPFFTCSPPLFSFLLFLFLSLLNFLPPFLLTLFLPSFTSFPSFLSSFWPSFLQNCPIKFNPSIIVCFSQLSSAGVIWIRPQFMYEQHE